MGGASVCTPCPAGSYCPNTTSGPVPCPAGTYSSTNSNTCTPCTIGTYSLGGVSACTPCPAGSYCATANSPPTLCPAGTYSSTSSSQCTECDTGTYSFEGAQRCTDCPAGSFCPTKDSAPTACPITTYNSSIKQTSSSSCIDCLTGKYCIPTDNNIGCSLPSNSCPTSVAILSSIQRTVTTVIDNSSFAAPGNSLVTSQMITGIIFDSNNNMYVGDSTNNSIRMFKSNSGVWTEETYLPAGSSIRQPFAGSIISQADGFISNKQGGTDGPRGTASFYSICGMVKDSTNTYIYVTDTLYHTIRRVTISTGNVLTIAGGVGPFTDAQAESSTTWVFGNVPSTIGQSIYGSSARFLWPQGLAIDNQNRLFVADSGNMGIKQVLTTNPYTTTRISTTGTYYSMACDGTNVYAATTTSIVKLSPSGTSWQETQIVGTFTSINSMIWRVNNLFVFDSNSIYAISPSTTKRLVSGTNNMLTSTILQEEGPCVGGMAFDINNIFYLNDFDRPKIHTIKPYLECA